MHAPITPIGGLQMNERVELRELLEAKKKRLYELQLKEASMGIHTPIHDLIEMKKLKEEIHELENQLSWYDDGSITSNDIPKVVCDTWGTGGEFTIHVEIHVTLANCAASSHLKRFRTHTSTTFGERSV
jgi:hypothetical protein